MDENIINLSYSITREEFEEDISHRALSDREWNILSATIEEAMSEAWGTILYAEAEEIEFYE